MVVTEVWALLMVGALVLLALVGLAVLADRPRTPRPDPAQLRAAAEELTADALRIWTEAGRAAAVARDARATLRAAERARDEAWAAQEAAERHHDEVRRTVAAAREAARRASAPVTVPAQTTAHDRVVSRAALSAYRRGDISLTQLREVFRRTGDWDPRREERERQLDQARIQLTAARRAYDRAAAVARRAERAARVAEVAARALLEEAEQSAVEADEAVLMAQRHLRRRGRRARTSDPGRGRPAERRNRPRR